MIETILAVLLLINFIINGFVIHRMRKFQQDLWSAQAEQRRLLALYQRSTKTEGIYP